MSLEALRRAGNLLVPVATAIFAMTGYLLLLTVAALRGLRQSPPDGPARRRFAILIPAHDEEALIGRLLASLAAVQYPPELVDVCVVADNCIDRTAELSRERGARVFERFHKTDRAKGFALRWLLERLQEEGRRYDAYVVLDADSTVSPNFLRRMDAHLQAGSQVVQAYYSVLNFEDSAVAALRYAALAAYHYLRPLGRAALGLSCGLKGNGMCFAAPVIERFAWEWYTLAEDVEFHLALVQAGVRVDFAPEVTVLAEMPVTLAQAETQNQRWERGRLQLLRHRVPGLLAEAVARRSALRLDAALEQFIPPLSVPFVVGLVGLLLGTVLRLPRLAGLSAASLAGQSCYLLSSLWLVGAPRQVYGALLHAPDYIRWKFGVYFRALLNTRSAHWIRTHRPGLRSNRPDSVHPPGRNGTAPRAEGGAGPGAAVQPPAGPAPQA